MNKVSRLACAAAVLCALAAHGARAQSACSSDSVARPVALLERFINADCESCWSDAKAPAAGRGELAIDWVLPGSRGDDAPLSSVARRDGLQRVEALRRKPPADADFSRHRAAGRDAGLRVAHGLPFNGYVGTTIQLKRGSTGPVKAWLLLVETLPSGLEGSRVERNLVRNALVADWDSNAGSGQKDRPLSEARSMSIPEGAKPERLRVVGWIEDARGQIRAIAQSRCTPIPGKG
jgi:hypothetical protein